MAKEKKQKQKTREGLQADNTLLEHQRDTLAKEITGWQEGDERRRKEISRMLDESGYEAQFYNENVYERRETPTYTWPQIYFRIGKLVAKRDYVNFQDQIRLIESHVKDLNREISKKKRRDDGMLI